MLGIARFAKTLTLLALAAGPFFPPLFPPAPEDPPEDPGSGFPKVGAALFVDGGGSASPRTLWGSVDCQRPARVRLARAEGDPTTLADGQPQDSAGFRRLRVVDGDDFSGERCELGLNDHRSSPVALYREGTRRITYLSLKLGKRFPLRRDAWQVVMQMKQSQPADTGGGIPVLALHADSGRWRLQQAGSDFDGGVWTAPASPGQWVRFAFDVTYSTDPERGAVQVSVDLNGDGDALDRGERGGRIELQTLKVEGPGASDDGLAQGDSIPSHLRVGIYHNPSYRCRGSKCSLGVDNVGVYEPG